MLATILTVAGGCVVPQSSEASCDDCATDCDGEFEVTSKITTKATSVYTDAQLGSARTQAVAALTQALQDFAQAFNAL
eukprot:COSAG01_NODE_7415_length_3217_cov_2.997114_4_plen_78_part_00